MKQSHYSLLAKTMVATLLSLLTVAEAKASVEINETNFPDAVFRNYVAGQLEESFIPVIYFSEKEKKIIKQRESLIKRNKRKNGFDFFEVKGFQFSTLAADESNLN